MINASIPGDQNFADTVERGRAEPLTQFPGVEGVDSTSGKEFYGMEDAPSEMGAYVKFPLTPV